MKSSAQVETDRLAALHRLCILDTPHGRVYDEITALATQLIEVPKVAITLIDRDRQWHKSTSGMDVRQTPRAITLFAHWRRPSATRPASARRAGASTAAIRNNAVQAHISSRT